MESAEDAGILGGCVRRRKQSDRLTAGSGFPSAATCAREKGRRLAVPEPPEATTMTSLWLPGLDRSAALLVICD